MEIQINRREKLLRMGYSEQAVSIIFQNKNLGKPESFNYTFKSNSDCGDMLILYLSIKESKIEDAAYEYVGCLGLQLSASILTSLIKGMDVAAAAGVRFGDIISAAGSIPPHKYECIHFAIETLLNGIKAKKLIKAD